MDRPSHHLFSAVSVGPHRAAIPGLDHSFRRNREDRIVRATHNICQHARFPLRIHLLGNVGDGAFDHQAPSEFIGDQSRTHQHPDRTAILAPQTLLEVR